VLGRDVVREAAAVRKLVSLAGQFSSVDADLTVEENLLLYRLLGLSRRELAVIRLRSLDLRLCFIKCQKFVPSSISMK
jgi:daunorubicin/doxorubicin transport system ATP-binding protein